MILEAGNCEKVGDSGWNGRRLGAEQSGCPIIAGCAGKLELGMPIVGDCSQALEEG